MAAVTQARGVAGPNTIQVAAGTIGFLINAFTQTLSAETAVAPVTVPTPAATPGPSARSVSRAVLKDLWSATNQTVARHVARMTAFCREGARLERKA